MARRHGLAVAAAIVGCVVMLGCGGDPQVPDTPDGTVMAVSAALAEGKPQVLWTAMPASYQKDVTGLVRTFADKMDADIYDKGVAVAKKLAAVLRAKRDFILAHPMLAMAKIDTEKAKGKWDTVVGMLSTVVNSELSSLESLKTLDVGKFLAGTGATLMEHASELSTLSADDPYNKEMVATLKGIKVEVVSADEQKAIVKITTPGKPTKEQEMVRVEGRWVPKDMADGWAKAMAEARAGLAKMSKEEMAKNKVQIIGLMGGIESVLDQMLKAETKEKFNEVVGQAMAMFMGGMGPKPGPPTPPPTPPFPPIPPAPRPGTR